MAHPLSPLTPSGQNIKSISSIARNEFFKSSTQIEHRAYLFEHGSENIFIDEPTTTLTSSPFIADIDIIVRSPLKHHSPSKSRSPADALPQMDQSVPLTEDALRENEDRNRPIKTLQDTKSTSFSDEGTDMMSVGGSKSYAGADDTCFSTFSAVPNADMTMFARIGQSPSKSNTSSPTKSSRHRNGARTPMHSRPTTPGTLRQRDYDSELPSSSPTPRHKHQNRTDDTTELMLDFTEQLSAFSQPSSSRSPQRNSPSKPSRHPDLAGYPAAHRLRSPTRDGFRPTTPAEARHLTNLLDFDLPPAPTPRSIPTITARELESLKSSFLSQISSLNATLSGKEAEISSLKGAKDDAEQRVGEALEQARDLKDSRDDLLGEKENWEKRDKEMQGLLRQVKEEIILNEKEREDLLVKSKDLEKRYEDAENRASEAESKIAGLEAGSTPIAKAAGEADHGDVSTPGSSSNKAVEVAVEKVARELHGLYKQKHESKVSALKKSYEARWEKKIRELQSKIEDLGKENEELRIGRDATMSGVVPGMLTHAHPALSQQQQESEEARIQREAEAERVREIEAEKAREMSAKLGQLVSEVEGVRKDNQSLHADLETSRRENSELVAAVEQMLLLESAHPPLSSIPEPLAPSNPMMSVSGESNLGFKASASSRASGLKGPGFGTMGAGAGERFGVKRSASGSHGVGGGLGMRSGIMGNIERMGRGRGVD